MELIVLILGSVVVSFIYTILLRAFAYWIYKMEVPYWNAYFGILTAYFVTILLCFVIGYLLAMKGVTFSESDAPIIKLAIFTGLLMIQTACISIRTKLTIGRAAWILFLLMAISFACFGAFALVFR